MSGQDFGHETHPVADKSHRCFHCIERIAPGTKHMRYVGVWEGEWQDWRMHEECLAASERTDREYGDPLCNDRHVRGVSCREMDIVWNDRNARKLLLNVYGVAL